VAISDHATSRAIPLQALRRKDDQLHKTANALISIANEFGIQAIVVGVPTGDENRSTKIVHFINTLWNSTPALDSIPVVLQDESYSTYEALVEMGGNIDMNHHRLLREATRKQKMEVDKYAACVILKRALQKIDQVFENISKEQNWMSHMETFKQKQQLLQERQRQQQSQQQATKSPQQSVISSITQQVSTSSTTNSTSNSSSSSSRTTIEQTVVQQAKPKVKKVRTLQGLLKTKKKVGNKSVKQQQQQSETASVGTPQAPKRAPKKARGMTLVSAMKRAAKSSQFNKNTKREEQKILVMDPTTGTMHQQDVKTGNLRKDVYIGSLVQSVTKPKKE